MIGVGYRHRTGTIFFTRNGRKLEDAYTGLRWNLFPTIGANGPCEIHVNLGQMGFVFVEANVKKWGLAPSQGTLAPPPAYGLERDTILLATGTSRSASRDQQNEEDTNATSSDQQPLLITIDDGANHAVAGRSSSMPAPPPYLSPQTSRQNSGQNVTEEVV